MKYLVAFFMWLVRLTWGVLDTLVGFFIFLFFVIRFGKKLHIGIVANTVVTEVPHNFTEAGWGLSSGLFIFSNTSSIWNKEYLLFHEWGHSWPQLLLMGPLHPFLVTLPSVVRFWWREMQSRKGKVLPPYDSIWFEGTATRWGTKGFQAGQKRGLWK